eukprot:UN04770
MTLSTIFTSTNQAYNFATQNDSKRLNTQRVNTQHSTVISVSVHTTTINHRYVTLCSTTTTTIKHRYVQATATAANVYFDPCTPLILMMVDPCTQQTIDFG